MSTPPHWSKLPHNTGTANSQAIVFEAGAHEFSIVRYVTLTSNYVRTPPPAYPDINPGQKPRHIAHRGRGDDPGRDALATLLSRSRRARRGWRCGLLVKGE